MKFHREIFEAQIALDIETETDVVLAASIILDPQTIPRYYPFFMRWRGVSFRLVNSFFDYLLKNKRG